MSSIALSVHLKQLGKLMNLLFEHVQDIDTGNHTFIDECE